MQLSNGNNQAYGRDKVSFIKQRKHSQYLLTLACTFFLSTPTYLGCCVMTVGASASMIVSFCATSPYFASHFLALNTPVPDMTLSVSLMSHGFFTFLRFLDFSGALLDFLGGFLTHFHSNISHSDRSSLIFFRSSSADSISSFRSLMSFDSYGSGPLYSVDLSL